MEASGVRTPGPWKHRDVSANGITLHIAEAGSGPLVLLLHGFAECWWVWRRQLSALADAGFRVVVPDLRGYGDSDKPPRGYDAWTLSGDISGLIRALGARQAHLVGHGWGGSLAWTTATLHSRFVASVCVVGAAHPLAARSALRPHVWRFQVPIAAERHLLADDAVAVQGYLRAWSAAGFDDAETSVYLRQCMQIPGVAHCSLEYYRWAFRSMFRFDGARFRREMARGCSAPLLQIHGADDECVSASAASASTAYAHGETRFELLDGVGHYPHLEAPQRTTRLLLEWLQPLA